MENEYLVSEFLDGTLDATSEERFFSLLSQESDLRNELKQQLAIKNAVRGDFKAFTPKADSTIQIFDKLGLILPITPIATVSPWNSALTKIGSAIKSGSAFVVTSAASALLTALLIFSFFDFDDNFESTKSLKTNNSERRNIEFTKLGVDNKVAKSESYADNSTAQIKERIIYKYIVKNDEAKNTDKLASGEFQDNSLSKNLRNEDLLEHSVFVSSINQNIQEFDLATNSNKSNNFELPNLIYDNLLSSFTNNNNKDYTLEARSSDYFSQRLQGVNPSSDLGLLNSAISFMYSFDSELSVGLDYRREAFSQEFTGKEADNYFIYRQEPNFQTYSAFVKYSPESIRYEVFAPFALLNFGFNSAGPVGRGMIGLDVNFSDYYYLTAGLDYSAMVFSQTNAYFISSKIGLHIGAGIRL